jgi:hypothetical protein
LKNDQLLYCLSASAPGNQPPSHCQPGPVQWQGVRECDRFGESCHWDVQQNPASPTGGVCPHGEGKVQLHKVLARMVSCTRGVGTAIGHLKVPAKSAWYQLWVWRHQVITMNCYASLVSSHQWTLGWEYPEAIESCNNHYSQIVLSKESKMQKTMASIEHLYKVEKRWDSDVVEHAYNPSYLEGRGHRRIVASLGKRIRPYKIQTRAKRAMMCLKW